MNRARDWIGWRLACAALRIASPSYRAKLTAAWKTGLAVWDRNRHDAEACHRCGSENPAWSAPSPLWNAVIRGGSINGDAEYGDMVCATCFMVLAEEKGIAGLFRVSADVVHVELETVTPSGRVWSDGVGQWVEP